MTATTTGPVRTSSRLPVLMYHSISAAADDSVSIRPLENQLTARADTGATLVRLTKALAILDSEPTRPVVALTFDDGVRHFRNAVEVTVTAAVKSACYRNGCVIGRRIARSTDNRFTIPRVEGLPSDTDHDIVPLASRGDSGLAPAAKRIAMPAWRLARRGAFSMLHRELS